ncbi:MAG: hypothetical protein KAW41_00720 [Candidatus Diapherotrites archaeon]|nr:hypothetical protein [Candidatus Diapherotrites archaeon]
MRLKPWNIDWVVRNTFRKLIGKKSLEDERQERMALLREMLYPGETRFVKPAMTGQYFSKLADDFTLSSIVLANRDGSVVAESGRKDIQPEKSIYDSVLKEIPDAKYLLIKGEKSTHVVCPDNGSLVVVEAMGNVSPIEMRALMRKIHKGDNS